jgi:hypothetical protein
MSQPAGQDDLKMVLARAFDRAWNRYYLPDRIGTISEEIARPSLAKHLVAMVKEGVNEEAALAAGGLLHLISLTPGMSEEFVAESEPPPETEDVSEPPAIVDQRHRPRTSLGFASRFATAIGISAIVAFVFFVLVPKSRNSDATELVISEHRPLPPAEAVDMTPEESQALLKKFLQWQQKP